MSPAIQEAKKRSKPKFALFVMRFCIDGFNHEELKRILDHVQMITVDAPKA